MNEGCINISVGAYCGIGGEIYRSSRQCESPGLVIGDSHAGSGGISTGGCVREESVSHSSHAVPACCTITASGMAAVVRTARRWHSSLDHGIKEATAVLLYELFDYTHRGVPRVLLGIPPKSCWNQLL